MPNNSYIRSTKRERQLVRDEKAKGNASSRHAASKGEFDLCSLDRVNKIVKFIQVKTTKGAKNLVIKDQETLNGYTVVTATYSYE